MSELELSAEALAVIAKVEKLLALANNNDNEHQAAAASAKAMELLAAYNLDMAMVGKTAKGAQRSDTNLKGGLYQWQRDLWEAVTKLNFCMYWSIRGLEKGSTYEHRILGRRENVVSARVMAEYLQQTVERLARERAKEDGYNIFEKAMIAYREGMASRLTERLEKLRADRLAEDERKKREAEMRARHPGAASTGTALVLADVMQAEADLNNDFLNGWEPGTTAQRQADYERKRREAQEAFDKQLATAQAERAAWELAHPVEAAAEKAEQARLAKIEEERLAKLYAKWDKQDYRNARRRKGTRRDRADTPAEARAKMTTFREGRRTAESIGLDQQIDKEDRKGIE